VGLLSGHAQTNYMATQTASKLSRIAANIQPAVARITITHPPLNVIDIPMMEELAQMLADVDLHPEIAAIVLNAEGKAFSAGVDVAAHSQDKVKDMLVKFHAVIRALVATKKVTIAAVHGSCLGGGAELAMVCDLVHTTESASWGFPEIKLGCYPPVAATALAALVGQKKASDLILTGRTISGSDAAAMGLATRAVSDGQLEAAVEKSLSHLRKLSPVALALTKKAIYAWDSMHFDKGLARAEKIYLEELMQTEDAQEGINSFLQKRPPKWKGR
jgi:cyclohexa-1,5-dienecarbonyl-CoA hydratase